MAHKYFQIYRPKKWMVYPGNTQKMDRNGTISVPNPGFVAGQLRLRRERNADPRPSVFQREEKESPAEASLSPKKW